MHVTQELTEIASRIDALQKRLDAVERHSSRLTGQVRALSGFAQSVVKAMANLAKHLGR